MNRLVLGLLAVTVVTAAPRVLRQAPTQPGNGLPASCVQALFATTPDLAALQACLLQGTHTHLHTHTLSLSLYLSKQTNNENGVYSSVVKLNKRSKLLAGWNSRRQTA